MNEAEMTAERFDQDDAADLDEIVAMRFSASRARSVCG
jgi:hypothetical protein